MAANVCDCGNSDSSDNRDNCNFIDDCNECDLVDNFDNCYYSKDSFLTTVMTLTSVCIALK